MKKAGLLAVLLLLGWFAYNAPYRVVNDIKAALASGDQVRLEDDIDFPAVRENLKAQLNGEMLRRMGNNPELRDSPLAGLATLVAPSVVGTMIDNFVTPAGLTSLMEGNDPREGGDGQRKPLEDASLSYDGLSHFKIDVPGRSGRHVLLYLGREGLGWKLNRIVLPIGSAAGTASS